MKSEVVLITGCSSGLGKGLCVLLVQKGYRVVATARDIGKIADVPADMKLELDVCDKKSIDHAIKMIIETYGKIDMLINNAGYSVRSAMEEFDLEEMSKMFDVNVYGVIRMIQAVAPYMRKENFGKIINVGSVSGKLTGFVNGGYCASKHAVEAISDATRLELRAFGIQVCVLEPGAIDTDFFHTLSKNSDRNMQNGNSPYHNLYQKDLNYRKKQKRADTVKATEEIYKIISREKLKARYRIVLPKKFSLLLLLPEAMRENMLLGANR